MNYAVKLWYWRRRKKKISFSKHGLGQEKCNHQAVEEVIRCIQTWQKKTERSWGIDTDASAAVRFEDDEHSNVTSESVPVIPHLTNHCSNTFPLVECLPERENPNQGFIIRITELVNSIKTWKRKEGGRRDGSTYEEREVGPEVDEVTVGEDGIGLTELLIDKPHD